MLKRMYDRHLQGLPAPMAGDLMLIYNNHKSTFLLNIRILGREDERIRQVCHWQPCFVRQLSRLN